MGVKAMRIYRVKDYEQLSKVAANRIAAQVTLKPDSVLGVATGSTPVGMYENLVKMYEGGDLDFSQVTTINLDEYKGLGKESSQSYAYYMEEKLFSKVNLNRKRTFVPDGTEPDSEKACQAYNEVLHRVGPADIQVLGIGHDGHIGFNEPADYFPDETHCVALDEMTIQANKRFFESEAEVPGESYTMGIGTIMRAKSILLLVSGAEKAGILKKALYGPVTPGVPASILQFHPDVTVIADEEALKEIE